jgi:hypothetical protein
MKNDISKVVFSILIAVAITVICYTTLKTYDKYLMDKLMKNPGIAEGLVYDKAYIKGQTIKVSYIVDSKTYYTSREASIEEEEAIKVGDHLTVKYEKGNPDNSIIIW